MKEEECHHFFQLTLNLHLSVSASCSHDGGTETFASHSLTFKLRYLDIFTHKLTHIFIIASYFFQLNHPDHHEQVVSTSLPDPPPLWTEMDALPLLHSTTPLLYYYSDTLLLRYSTTTTFTPLLHFYYYYNDHNYTSSLQNSPLKMLCFSFRTTRHFHCDF